MNFQKCLSLNTFVSNISIKRNLNCNVSSITKIHREIYTRTYPTKVVLPNGASINIRYYEPRQIIRVSTYQVKYGKKNIVTVTFLLC